MTASSQLLHPQALPSLGHGLIRCDYFYKGPHEVLSTEKTTDVSVSIKSSFKEPAPAAECVQGMGQAQSSPWGLPAGA